MFEICTQHQRGSIRPHYRINHMANKTKIVYHRGGCFSLILTILVLWALWFGLPTPWGVFEIDVFPPGIFIDR